MTPAQIAASLAAMATLTLEASDRRQAQEALEQHVRERTGELRRTTAHLQTIIEESPLAMIELDQAGLVTTWNAAATCIRSSPASLVVPAATVSSWALSAAAVPGK